ncbi:FAD-dependent monooxygenase [Pseudonocardia sp. DSM 110487]|uniref:FAD-dependent oxidoreductase n=1 Tax=Pseudonocardia sp. DSM 110487 TaxID=2865833 RepID=UPI001C6A0F93|nr:FAD-dependent monooxygenase [Pseudonocardia sp. DSM 110487]QYN38211.1 FAD-dependent monooxygenase [Pseudonocardia sp. DSM 110487]
MTRILISGGGIGGLALAQALRRTSLDVAVYERDPSPELRNQGYRIHIDRDGNAALAACLPQEVLDLARRTSGVNGDLVAGYTHQLEQLMAQVFTPTDDELTCVDRYTFRQGLLTGMADIVHFGQTVACYEVLASGRVRVDFAEGGSDEGDLLVGADGVGSAVRRQLLPHATVRDIGVRCLYGRMPLTGATDPLVPADFDRGFSWVADRTGYGAGFAPVRFRTPPGNGASDYLMTTLTATPERLGVSDEKLFRMAPEELWRLTIDATAAWHADVRELFAHADASTFFPITIRAGERVEAWEPGPVTLLGDAIHTMPPTGGVGANTALRDAQTLAGELTRGSSLVDAVAAYERVMLPRGFEVVDSSLRMAGQLFGTPSVSTGGSR